MKHEELPPSVENDDNPEKSSVKSKRKPFQKKETPEAFKDQFLWQLPRIISVKKSAKQSTTPAILLKAIDVTMVADVSDEIKDAIKKFVTKGYHASTPEEQEAANALISSEDLVKQLVNNIK